jgi:hypothetical protein
MKTAYFLLLFFLIIVSCKKEDSTQIETILPDSNKLILSQRISGDDNSKSTIYKIINDTLNSFIISGGKNNQYIISKIIASGSSIWETPIGFNPHVKKLGNSIIVVGQSGTKGVIVLIDPKTGLIQNSIYLTDMEINILDVAYADNQFYAFGYSSIGTVYFPIIIRFQIDKNKNIIISEKKIFYEYPNTKFNIIVDKVVNKFDQTTVSVVTRDGNGNELPPISDVHQGTLEGIPGQVYYLNFYVIGQSSTKFTVNSISCNNLTDIKFIWSTDVFIDKDKTCYANSAIISDSVIYVVGSNQTYTKLYQNNLVNSCFISGISKNSGKVLYKKTYSISQYPCNLYDCIIDKSNIIACGIDLEYQKDDKSFGYGLLIKLDKLSGELLKSNTFGSYDYYSNFNTIAKSNNFLYLGGFTQQYKKDGNFKSWFVEMNIE